MPRRDGVLFVLQLGIEAVSGGIAKGDIAIDEITYSTRSCASLHPTTTSGKFTCDFEDQAICGYMKLDLYYCKDFRSEMYKVS